MRILRTSQNVWEKLLHSVQFLVDSFFIYLALHGMKVYLTEEKELIMELSMKWAGNPNIIVAAKAFRLRAMWRIDGKHVQGSFIDCCVVILYLVTLLADKAYFRAMPRLRGPIPRHPYILQCLLESMNLPSTVSTPNYSVRPRCQDDD
ncbi:hypothetical protein NL676_036578 [Syzygium grande]|nr:hypothetical protein NL676_036578 [Syzygium grande]